MRNVMRDVLARCANRVAIKKSNRLIRNILRQPDTRQFVFALQHGFDAVQHYIRLQCGTE